MTEKKLTRIHTWSIPDKILPENTFEAVYEAYYDIIFKNAYSKVDQHIQDAEDLTQEIFLRILTRFNTLNFSCLSSCLSRLAKQAQIDWFRKYQEAGLDLRKFDDLYDPEADYFERADPECNDPLLMLVRAETEECMVDNFSMLSNLDAQLFVNVYIEGWKVRDAAKALEISQTSAETKLWRIRNKLATCLSSADVIGMIR